MHWCSWRLTLIHPIRLQIFNAQVHHFRLDVQTCRSSVLGASRLLNLRQTYDWPPRIGPLWRLLLYPPGRAVTIHVDGRSLLRCFVLSEFTRI